MTGVFAAWQPRYAEHGVAAFPVKIEGKDKRGWGGVGLPGWAQLALEFAEDDAVGSLWEQHHCFRPVALWQQRPSN